MKYLLGNSIGYPPDGNTVFVEMALEEPIINGGDSTEYFRKYDTYGYLNHSTVEKDCLYVKLF